MNSAAPAYLPMNTAAAAMAAIGSGASASDIETLRSYLALREQDVAVLTGQMRSSHDRIQQLEMQVKLERARANELQHLVQKQEQTIKNYDQDKQVDIEVLYKQVEDLNLQLKERTDKARSIESKLKFTLEEVQKVKDRVRVDIRRIRVREKELENQLEILKKDSSSLLLARDEKIIELKRKIDLLEFNMELVQEQYGKERHIAEQLRARLKDAVGVMRQAGGLLDLEQ
jgi:chromosome segregation ATPase